MTNKNNSPALDALFWRDEILQVLFWLQGEGFAEAPSARELDVFLDGDVETIGYHLEKLTGEGYLVRHAAAVESSEHTRYALSEHGEKEAARRFKDAFADMQKQGHGACSPDCICQGGEIGHDPNCPTHGHHH